MMHLVVHSGDIHVLRRCQHIGIAEITLHVAVLLQPRQTELTFRIQFACLFFMVGTVISLLMCASTSRIGTISPLTRITLL